jgi:hypothetical protein
MLPAAARVKLGAPRFLALGHFFRPNQLRRHLRHSADPMSVPQVTWDRRVTKTRSVIAYLRYNQRDRLCAIYNDLRLLGKASQPFSLPQTLTGTLRFLHLAMQAPHYCLRTTRWRVSGFHSSQIFFSTTGDGLLSLAT